MFESSWGGNVFWTYRRISNNLNLFMFNRSSDLKIGSVWALYLQSVIILMKRFCILSNADNWIPMPRYSMLGGSVPYCNTECGEYILADTFLTYLVFPRIRYLISYCINMWFPRHVHSNRISINFRKGLYTWYLVINIMHILSRYLYI